MRKSTLILGIIFKRGGKEGWGLENGDIPDVG
jgi:hypothetical protein